MSLARKACLWTSLPSWPVVSGAGRALLDADHLELIGLIPIEPGLRQYFLDTFRAQVDALCACQAGDGMWHTILDDPASYKESSATAAFAYGMLKGVRLGFLPAQYEAPALRAVQAVLARVDAAGIVGGVSYGTPVGNEDRKSTRLNSSH